MLFNRLQLLICSALLFIFFQAPAQSYQINFSVKLPEEDSPGDVGVRGNIPPLSWDKTFFLEDADEDGIFTGTLTLKTDLPELQFKFVKNDHEYELEDGDNRFLTLENDNLQVEANFDVYQALGPEELTQIRFDPAAIREDIAVLKLALSTIHPNLFRYIDPTELEEAYTELEHQLLTNNDLPSAYKYITRFIARIQCSHTITNPWNQKPLIKQALFYQPDKVPFTFRVLNRRLFIDKNASEETRLKPGVEILAINGVSSGKVLERLLPYISADGANDAKRWYSLNLSGAEKFETFDILFPLEFELGNGLEMTVKDHRKNLTFSTRVALTSKTERTAVLQKRYPGLAVTDDDLWQFNIINDQAAYLKLGTFVTWQMQMDWKQFLKDAFRTLNKNSIPNLIIDIRDNVGGLDEVYTFILEHLINKPLSVNIPASKIAYQKIPAALRPYIGTWDDNAFDFGKRLEPQADGYFLSKPVAGKNHTLKVQKDGYSGKTYLIINAANSSATHHMATYMKRYQLGTLVGRTTGGNQRGMNGGMIFFTTLPNTQIEVDIPIFGTYTPEDAPNNGIEPDIPVKWTPKDLIEPTDPDLQAIWDHIEARH